MHQPQQKCEWNQICLLFQFGYQQHMKVKSYIKIVHIVGYQLELNVDFDSFFKILTVFKFWQSKTPKMAYLKITN